jgi:hypothetical protein
MANQGMPVGVRGGPQQEAEAPRIAESQRITVAQNHVEMIVIAGWFCLFYYAEAAGHAEVNDGGAPVGVEKEILGPTPHPCYRTARQHPVDASRHGLTQLALANDYPGYRSVLDPRFNAAARRFNFR